MSEDRRRAAATATLGYGGLVGSGALRHTGLERAYRGGKRPPLLQEAQFLRRGVKGKVPYLAGAALAVPSGTAAAYGTSHLMRRRKPVAKRDDQRRRSFLAEGLAGTKESMSNRSDTLRERPPAGLVAGNYLGGALIGSVAGGGLHHGLGRTKLPGALRAGLATAGAVAAGSATIPLQSRMIERASRGKYVATAGGVRRKKTKPVRPSRYADVVDGRSMHPAAFRQQTVGKMSPRKAANTLGAVTGAHWTTHLSRAADFVEPYEARRRKPVSRPLVDRHLPNAQRLSSKLVRTGRTKAAETLRSVSYDVSSLNDKDKLIREVGSGQGRLAVAKDLGAGMSRTERRARVTAAGSVPVVGDFAQAGVAASMSPDKYRRRTAVQNYVGGQAGQVAGMGAGTAGALALARRSPGFNRRATAASDGIDRAKSAARRSVGLPEQGKGIGARVLEHERTPAGLKRAAGAIRATRAGRAIAANPKVAAVGALAGGWVGGQAGQQLTYGHIMSRDDRYRRKQAQIAKDANTGMTRREEYQQLRRKQRAAAATIGTNVASLGATGALAASFVPRFHHKADALRQASFGIGTVSGGLGAANSLHSSRLQRKELRARRHVLEQQGVDKALGLPRPRLAATGIRRAPSMRRGFIRQTRMPSGITRVSSVRGGLA